MWGLHEIAWEQTLAYVYIEIVPIYWSNYSGIFLI